MNITKNTLTVAIEYILKMISFEGMKIGTDLHQWQANNWKNNMEPAIMAYLKDARLKGSNEYFYSMMMELAIQYSIEKHLGIPEETGFDMAKRIITESKTSLTEEQIRDSDPPQILIDKYCEELKKMPPQLYWYNLDNTEKNYVELFSLVWIYVQDEGDQKNDNAIGLKTDEVVN